MLFKIVKLISVLPLYQEIFQCALMCERGRIYVLVNSKMSLIIKILVLTHQQESTKISLWSVKDKGPAFHSI